MNNYSMNYLKLSRDIFSEKNRDLTLSAKWLYCVLCDLEYKYSSNKNELFYRSNNDLAVDAGMSEKTVRTAKKELVEAGLIEAVQIHFIDDAGKRSQKHITGYKIK